MLYLLIVGEISADMLLHPSGEMSARFMLIALAITPLRRLWPEARWVRVMGGQRRTFGVSAFGYAVLHTMFYVIDMDDITYIMDEVFALGIWTGWVALLVLFPLALTSNKYSVYWLKGNWRHLHRLIYLAAILVLLHWNNVKQYVILMSVIVTN